MSDSLATKKKKPLSRPLTRATAPSWLRWAAILSGIVGFVLFIATPFLPVKQVQSSFDWPQNESVNSVNAPLISVAPEEIDATIPVSAIDDLRDGQTLLYGTVPPTSKNAETRGLFVNADKDGGLSITSLDEVLLSLTKDEVKKLSPDDTITLSVTEDETEVTAGSHSKTVDDEDLRPQVTGVYTELDDDPATVQALTDDGLNVSVDINSRFTSSPTVAKYAAMWLGLAMTLVSLFCLYRIDKLDGRQNRFMPATWKQIRPLDGVVALVLLFWHVLGANTSDDGFIMTMARVSDHADYMANYFRWYGVPESPFGSPYYDLLALMTKVSTASLWMRLPALIAGFMVWFILSREILPRLGAAIDGRRVAHWTAALMFLAFWLPYNNGVRPEPLVALGVMLTWASFERAIANSRLLPAAVGTLLATITLGVGPTGLFAVGVFLVSLPHLFRIMARRVNSVGGGWLGWLALIAPFLAIGTAILIAVFGDQTLAAVLESTRVRSEVGPALPWFSEYARYATLFEQSVDGSMTRRFAMFMMLFCLALITLAFVRNNRVAGAAVGPTRRMLIIVALSMFFLLFTPTKWTHHFGIYAGVAGAVAALGAVVLSRLALRSARARTFSLAAVVLLLAFTFAGWNAWWYVSSFGVPWWDRTVQFKAIEANTVILAIGLVILLVAAIQSLVHRYRAERAHNSGNYEEFRRATTEKSSRWAGIMSAPIAIACALMVVFSMATFAKAYVTQGEAYSVGKGNTRALTGNTCNLANDVLVETNTNDAFLEPVKGDLADSLVDKDEDFIGFDPNNIPESIEPENQDSPSVGAIGNSTGSTDRDSSSNSANSANSTDSTDSRTGSGSGSASDSDSAQDADTKEGADRTESKDAEKEAAATDGVRDDADAGVNGSTRHLPFNLDYRKVPVLGSYDEEQQGTSKVTTQWYRLPERSEDSPVLSVAAAGRIHHHDVNGVEQKGLDLELQYATVDDSGKATDKGTAELSDVGATPEWRNLRVALDEIPDEANAVRLVAKDDSLDERDWLAFTPPRVPTLEPLNDRFDGDTPGLLDWSTAFQFPCQRPFDHYAGVTEIPEFRVLPDAAAKSALTDFQSYSGGGAMSTAEAVNYSYEIPAYLNHDWARDWGAVQKYELRTNSEGEAPALADIDHETITRSGLWKNSEMKIKPEGEK